MKVSTSTVAALFSKMALTSQRIAMVDMVLLVFPAFPSEGRKWGVRSVEVEFGVSGAPRFSAQRSPEVPK